MWRGQEVNVDSFRGTNYGFWYLGIMIAGTHRVCVVDLWSAHVTKHLMIEV